MKTFKRNPIGNQNNDPLNPPATAQKQPAAASINQLAHNMYQSNSHYSNPNNLHSLHKKKSPKRDQAQRDQAQRDQAQRDHAQRAQAQRAQYFNGARCRHTFYSKQQILDTVNEACYKQPTQDDKKATVYKPKHPEKYLGHYPFYLYPLGKELFRTKSGPHYGRDRIVLNSACQLEGVLTEWPKPFELVKKTSNVITGRPWVLYNQKNYWHSDCEIFWGLWNSEDHSSADTKI
ncbi:hypothetical protein EPUL_002964, partial [Erysiphe pulchra]